MKTKSISIMQANFTLLRFHGLWPTHLNFEQDRFYRPKLTLVFCAISVLWYSATFHLLNIITEKKQNVQIELLEDISMSMASVGLYYIFAQFLWKRDAITVLLRHLEDYSEFGKPANVDKINDSFNLLSKIYYFYCVAGIVFYFAIAQTTGTTACRERNERFTRNEVCGFFSPLWMPFNYNYTPVYEILMTIQLLSGMYAAPVLTISFMVFVIVQHVCCKIRHLKSLMVEVFCSQDAITQRTRLIKILRYHQFIIRLCEEVNHCFGHIMFLYITLGVGILSVTGYQSLKQVSMASVIHLGAWVITLSVVCAAGQQLSDESASVSYTFYDTDWIDADNAIKVILKIMLMRSQKPLCLRALSFGVMSLSAFQAVISTAYRYLTLMRQTMQ